MKLAIEVDIPVVTCVGCGDSADMEVKAVLKDASDGDLKWKPSIVVRPDGWKAVLHDPNTKHGLCPECAEKWVPMLERQPPPPMPLPRAAAPEGAQLREAILAQLPKGVVPPVPLPPIGAAPPILIDSRPKTVAMPAPPPSAIPRHVVPNLAPPTSARAASVGNVQLAQAPVHVTSQRVEHVKQTAVVSPIPVLVPQAPPEPPPPAIMSKTSVIPAAQPAAAVDPTKTGEWIRPENGSGR